MNSESPVKTPSLWFSPQPKIGRSTIDWYVSFKIPALGSYRLSRTLPDMIRSTWYLKEPAKLGFSLSLGRVRKPTKTTIQIEITANRKNLRLYLGQTKNTNSTAETISPTRKVELSVAIPPAKARPIEKYKTKC